MTPERRPQRQHGAEPRGAGRVAGRHRGPSADGPDPAAPRAERRPAELVTHGDRRIDDWTWLADRDDPEVVSLLERERAWTEGQLAPLGALRERLFSEIRSHTVETDMTVAWRHGPWWYYTRTEEGAGYAVHCRLPAGTVADHGAIPPGSDAMPLAPWPAEQVVLDENALAAGHPYFAVANRSVSPGHRRLAYATDTSGDERFELRVRDLEQGTDLPESIAGTSYGVVWANDETTLFYTRPDGANRPYQVWRHVLGSDTNDDVLVYQEDDERFHVGVQRTRDGAFVLIEAHSAVTSEVHALPAEQPTRPPRPVVGRRSGVEYSVEHHGETFLLLTNDTAENFRLVATPAHDAERARWVELIPNDPAVRLEGVDVFARHVVCYERRDGDPRIRVLPLPDPPSWSGALRKGWLVPSPETPSASWPGPNPEFDTHTLRYDYSSLVTPRSTYDLDLDARRAQLRRRQPVPGGFEREHYTTERLWATASDGVQVPVSVVSRRGIPSDATAPCVLYGYGAYEHSVDAVFSATRLSLLDRGVVFAIAHVRGGGELGRRWYEDGKLLRKPHTFGDFIACARHLVDLGRTRADRLVARGASAGGLLVGAVLNEAPGLFGAAVAEVPFVDCLTTLLDDRLPLTVIEWEEWGDPGARRDVYDVIKSYSPYDNVQPRRYPDVLVTTGLEDARVAFWEPVKWVQKLRAADVANRVLLKVELAGHGGPSGRYDAWRDEAEVMAFMLDAVGCGDEPTHNSGRRYADGARRADPSGGGDAGGGGTAHRGARPRGHGLEEHVER